MSTPEPDSLSTDRLMTDILDELLRLKGRNEFLERRQRYLQGLSLAVLLLLAGVASITLVTTTFAQAVPPVGQDGTAPAPAATDEALQQLVSQLTAEEREELERFEEDVRRLKLYMSTRERGDGAAMVALFLSRIARNMDAVPKMLEQMEVMNAKMNALPALAGEVSHINGKMGVMTHSMDSTMGRMGRMFPWMP